jgi:hypothetical protein
MSLRRVPGVASSISPTALVRGLADSVRAPADLMPRARTLVERRYGAERALLTDSGTSALVLALRLTVPRGGAVGFPGYACVDLAAAARFAGVRVRLYDLDPSSLGPDLDAVDRLLRRGVDALVVAHLFGYPADVEAVRARAARAGVPVIEDAAQGAGGALRGRRLGSLGELAVLSFGRGKGLCAGGGGALLALDARWAEAIDALALRAPTHGWSNLAKTTAQWALGRPSVYALPSMIPGLHLGEMVYHPAHEPASLSLGSSSLLSSAIALEDVDVSARRAQARRFDDAASTAPRLAPAAPPPGSEPGFLRYAVRDLDGARTADASLGVLRPYPRTLSEQEELRPMLLADEPSTPGAIELRRSLFVLPTHRFVGENDARRISRWLAGDDVARPLRR